MLLVSDALHVNGEDRPIHLGMNRLNKNPEIEQLMAKYHAFLARQILASTDLDHDASPSLSSVMRNLASGVASKIWRSDSAAATDDAHEDNHSTTQAVETRIRTGEGSHTITVYVGGQPRELIIDTGSGKTAFICDGCSNCGTHHTNPPFHLTNRTKYIECNPSNLGNVDLGGCMECAGSKCRYGQRYVEGDSWEAYKAEDVMGFTLPDSRGEAFEAMVQFGCIYEQTGCFNEQTSDGIMGFSRHPDSIFEQFHRQGVTQSRIFAQCLAKKGGALTLGGVDMTVNKAPEMYTPLRETGYQYWTVNLESITVDKAHVDVPASVYNADRGCVFDSGTTFVYLPTRVRAAFVASWRQAMGGRDEFTPMSDTFYRIDDTFLFRLPEICFHFPNEAKLCMGAESYFYRLSTNRYAGTIYFSDTARSTIIGASALAHHNIIYDVDNNRIGMAVADCDAAVARTSVDALQQQMIALEMHPGGDTFRSIMDKEYWSNVALLSVAFVAIAGLVVTVWEGVREGGGGHSQQKRSEAATNGSSREQLRLVEDDDGDAFAFILMPEEGEI